MSLAAIVGCSDECRDLGGGHRACGARMAEVPIIGSDGAFIVAGRVNGRQAELLVDTGADTTVISSQFLAVADQSSRWLDELCLGDYCLAREAVFAWETPFSSMVAGAPQGFVGMSTLAHLSVSFAFGKQLTIGDEGDGCIGHSVALTLSEVGTPLAAIRLDGSDFGDMTIDTGAARSVLAQATVDRLGGYLKDQAVPTSSCTVLGCSDNSAYLGRVQELCVGDVCARDVEVKFPAWDAVGANWLAGHNVRFDFRQRAVIFCDL